MSVEKRGKRWGAVAYIGSKHKWLGTFDSQKEAKAAEAKALLEHRQGDDQTVAAFAGSWLLTHPRPKRSTEVHYEQATKGFVSEFGKWRLADLSRVQMRRWAVEHPSQAGAARAMLGDAVRDGLLPANPLAGMRLPSSRGRRDIQALTDEQVRSLIACAEKVHGDYGRHMYAPMIQVAAYTGLRPGELHGLRWEDINLNAETLRVERQFSPKANTFTSPKNGKARTVPILPPAREAFKSIMRGTRQEIFLTKQGKHFSGRVSHYYFDPVRAAFGDPSLSFYELRHHFGTMLARMGLGAPEIARILGHTDGGALALRTYIHTTEDEAVERAKALFTRPQLKVVGG